MDQSIRNKLRNVVTQCRKLLEEAVTQVLQGQFGISTSGKKDEVHVEDESSLKLSAEDQGCRRDLVAHLGHIQALGYKAKDALAQLVREIAFTHLNRLCAYKMMEARAVWIGGKPFRESVGRSMKSQGFQFYLADDAHKEDKRLFDSGHQDIAYRHFLGWLGALLSEEIGVLFSPSDPANRLFPPQRVLDDVLALLNGDDLKDIWSEDETVGWVYQYFTPKELRDQVRKESAAPRNSYELAFRNQFFTPRYVVEFLTDNTLGRIWYEMRKGDTKLKDQCRYMVRRPSEVFLADPVAAARQLGITVKDAEDIPLTVQSAFRGDFANAVDETSGRNRSWIGLAVPFDQYKAATGHPFRENDEHPTVTEVWAAIHEPSEGSLPLPPLKVLVALSQLVVTASGGPYAARAMGELWTAFVASVKAQAEQSDLSQEELLKQPVCIPNRPKKDPRELRILDPACGSGHFLLYCFDLLLTIYEEAYADPDLGPKLKEEYPTLDALRRDVPRLILAHNLHGIDIDLRASQIAALALWLRCQRAYREMGLKQDRPKITKSNIVCAEPMPGESEMLKEFVADLQPKVLGHLVEVVFDKMKLAGEAGSLLKIEEELRDAIADVKKKWVAETERATDRKGQPLLFTVAEMDRLSKKTPQPQLFDFSEITDEQFWNEAENQVLVALRNYAAHAANGGKLKKQLFAEDAERGFAFIDLCQNQFDVVLMNPPFGETSKAAKSVLEKQYSRTKSDLYAAFVERGLNRLHKGGLLGAITSRTGFFLTSFEKWRKEILLDEARPTVFADLGYGVLDTAMVETAAYCLINRRAEGTTTFCRLLQAEDKETTILATVLAVSRGEAVTDIFQVDPVSFGHIPGSPFAYWVSSRIRSIFGNVSTLENENRFVKQGLATGDDFRFIRLRWEVPQQKIVPINLRDTPASIRAATHSGKRWVGIVRGSGFKHFFTDFHALVDWESDGDAIRTFCNPLSGYIYSRYRGADYYFRPGITWPLRGEVISTQAVPLGMIFSIAGKLATSLIPEDLSFLLAVTNSQVFATLLAINSGSVGGTQFEAGLIARTPCPKSDATGDLEKLANTGWKLQARRASHSELSSYFCVPEIPLFHIGGESKAELSFQSSCESTEQLAMVIDRINRLSNSLYNVSLADIHSASRLGVIAAENTSRSDNTGDEDEVEVFIDDSISEQIGIQHLYSYSVGCVFGRWDILFAIGKKPKPELPDPFDPLPVCSPGMLQGEGGLPLSVTPPGYPLRIDSDGIVPDDPDHSDDIVRRVREALELIGNDRAEAIEKEACEIFGVKELRDYFRKLGKGGFWDDHVSRYSKSRRKAPIYWLLQSSKKNYGMWLYYHRIDKDMLFKARQNYVDPKIRLEQTRLDSLRSQKTTLGADAKGAKKIDKEIEKQENLLAELKDFAEKLERAAKLNFGDPAKLDSNVVYDPDLNDGVVLSIAPLWELVPWKEAKNYWEELLEGQYDWSSMGKLLRKKGLVK